MFDAVGEASEVPGSQGTFDAPPCREALKELRSLCLRGWWLGQEQTSEFLMVFLRVFEGFFCFSRFFVVVFWVFWFF